MPDIIGKATGFNYTQRWGSQLGQTGSFNPGGRPPSHADWEAMSQEERNAVGVPDWATYQQFQQAWEGRNQAGGDVYAEKQRAGQLLAQHQPATWEQARQILLQNGYDPSPHANGPLFKELETLWNGGQIRVSGTAPGGPAHGGMVDYSGTGLSGIAGWLPGMGETMAFQDWLSRGISSIEGRDPQTGLLFNRTPDGQMQYFDDLGYRIDPSSGKVIGHYNPAVFTGQGAGGSGGATFGGGGAGFAPGGGAGGGGLFGAYGGGGMGGDPGGIFGELGRQTRLDTLMQQFLYQKAGQEYAEALPLESYYKDVLGDILGVDFATPKFDLGQYFQNGAPGGLPPGLSGGPAQPPQRLGPQPAQQRPPEGLVPQNPTGPVERPGNTGGTGQPGTGPRPATAEEAFREGGAGDLSGFSPKYGIVSSYTGSDPDPFDSPMQPGDDSTGGAGQPPTTPSGTAPVGPGGSTGAGPVTRPIGDTTWVTPGRPTGPAPVGGPTMGGFGPLPAAPLPSLDGKGYTLKSGPAMDLADRRTWGLLAPEINREVGDMDRLMKRYSAEMPMGGERDFGKAEMLKGLGGNIYGIRQGMLNQALQGVAGLAGAKKGYAPAGYSGSGQALLGDSTTRRGQDLQSDQFGQQLSFNREALTKQLEAQRSANKSSIFSGLLGSLGQLGAGLLGNPALFASDARVKENIEPHERGLEDLQKVKTYSWEYIDSGEEQFGVIAQELEKIMPEAVTEVEGIKHIKPMHLLATTMKAVQELAEEMARIRAPKKKGRK